MKDYQDAVEQNWENYKYAVGKLGITASCYHKKIHRAVRHKALPASFSTRGI